MFGGTVTLFGGTVTLFGGYVTIFGKPPGRNRDVIWRNHDGLNITHDVANEALQMASFCTFAATKLILP